jgi:hydrogenase maturation protease
LNTLLIGIGNPGRGDDALGPALAARLAGLEPGSVPEGAVIDIPVLAVSASWKYQLNIEDAHLIKDCGRVVFADAEAASEIPVALRRVEPAAAIAFTTHEMTPASVLALCEELYGRAPEGWLLTMRGYVWALGENLSARAALNLEEALRRIREFVLSGLD